MVKHTRIGGTACAPEAIARWTPTGPDRYPTYPFRKRANREPPSAVHHTLSEP